MLHRSIIRLRCSEIALCLVTDRTVFARAEMAGPLINYVLFRFDTILSLDPGKCPESLGVEVKVLADLFEVAVLLLV